MLGSHSVLPGPLLGLPATVSVREGTLAAWVSSREKGTLGRTSLFLVGRPDSSVGLPRMRFRCLRVYSVIPNGNGDLSSPGRAYELEPPFPSVQERGDEKSKISQAGIYDRLLQLADRGRPAEKGPSQLNPSSAKGAGWGRTDPCSAEQGRPPVL